MIEAESGDIGVRELARRLGLSPTIVQRLVSSLADRVDGRAPAGIVASTLPSSGLSRKTTSSGTIETHTESRSTARSVRARLRRE